MADINVLKNTYFLSTVTSRGASTVTALVDGSAFGLDLKDEILRLGGGADQFILIASWWLGLVDRTTTQGTEPGYGFGPPSASDPLLPLLVQKARAGVDVRVMAWVSPALIDSAVAQLSGGSNFAEINRHTLLSIKALRAAPEIAGKAILKPTRAPRWFGPCKGCACWRLNVCSGIYRRHRSRTRPIRHHPIPIWKLGMT